MGLSIHTSQSVFQALFGMIMIVLITLEFDHSALSILERQTASFR
jgi:hypothetical protein